MLWTGVGRDGKYHKAFVIAAVIQIIIECILVETAEWFWVYFVTPWQIEADMHKTVASLKECIDNTFLVLENEQFNTSEYLFVSTKVAKRVPHLMESTIVLSYQTQYLRNLNHAWTLYIDEWVDRSWDIDVDYAIRLLYIAFMKWTLLRGVFQLSLLLGTLPIVYQRMLVRMVGIAFCTAIYIAVLYSRYKLYIYLIVVAAWVVHEVLAYFCRLRESNKVSIAVSTPSNRRRNNLDPLNRASSDNNITAPSNKKNAKKMGPQRYIAATPPTVMNQGLTPLDAKYSSGNSSVNHGTPKHLQDKKQKQEEENKEEEVTNHPILMTLSQQPGAPSPIAGANTVAIEGSIECVTLGLGETLVSDKGGKGVVQEKKESNEDQDEDILHVSFERGDGGNEDNHSVDEKVFYDDDYADDDDNYSTFYPSMQNMVEAEYDDVLNAIDTVLQQGSDSN